jgi:hypothetical protein
MSEEVATMTIQPLLETLNKISMGRILPHSEIVTDKDLSVAKIPVAMLNSADKTDVAMRRYAADWIRKEFPGHSVEHKFERVRGISWYDNGSEIPVVGIIHVSWWKSNS